MFWNACDTNDGAIVRLDQNLEALTKPSDCFHLRIWSNIPIYDATSEFLSLLLLYDLLSVLDSS